MTRRRMGGLASAAAGVLSLSVAGCRQDVVPPEARGPVTLRYMSNQSETSVEGAARLVALDQFNATNTLAITVDVSEAKAVADVPKVKTLAAAGTPPDIYFSGYTQPADLLVSGVTIDIEPELKKERDWPRQRADMFPNMLETLIWAGKLVGMPVYTNNRAMIYNVGLLQQAGVAPPKPGWTWEDFRVMAQRFTGRAELLPLSIAWTSAAWITWLGTAGARIITRDSRKITADTPEMLQLLELWLDFLNRGITRLTPDGNNFVSEQYRLAKNDTVFEDQGVFRIPVLREANAPDFRTTHAPVHPVKREVFSSNSGHAVTVPRTTAAKQYAACLVAKWLNAPPAQALICIRASSIPVSKATLQVKELQDFIKSDPAYKEFFDLAPKGWRWPALPSYERIAQVIQQGIAAIMRREIGVKPGLIRMQQDAQVLLDADVRLMA